MVERLHPRIEEVTSRQLEVARLVAEGRTNPEIAAALGITLDGAKYHVSELLGRLGLERREEIRQWYRSEHRARRVRGLSALLATAPRAFATAAAVTLVVAVGALFALGLSGGRAEEGVTPMVTATPTATPPLEPGVVPPVGAVGDASDLPDELDWLPVALGERLRAAPLEVVSWERVDWFDGCFDIDVPGGCPLSVSPVPGYRMVLRHPFTGDEYVARMDLGGARYRLESTPTIAPFEVAFQWTGTTDYFCIDLILAEDGTGTIASCGEAPTPVDLSTSNVGRSGFLDYLYLQHLLSFAPFEVDEPADPMTLIVQSHGTGGSVSDGWPRAAEEWGRIVALDAYLGHSNPSVNPSVAARWRDNNAPDCTEVEVWRSAMVHLRGCTQSEDRIEFLAGVDVPRLYAWLDREVPFSRDVDGAAVEFFGLGHQLPEEGFRERVLGEWLAALAEGGPTASE